MTESLDPIRFELFKNSIVSIADEMALTIVRTSYSGILKANLDFSTGFADGDGQLVAQGLTLPAHLGSAPTALAEVIKRFDGDIHPEDVFVINDPFAGGMHLPDIFLFKPIFVGDRRMAFAVTCAHHADVGGRVAGSNASDSTEIYQEGLRIPPLKLYDRGVRNDTLFSLLETNVRLPVDLIGDIRAQMAACTIAERQFFELVDLYGADQVNRFMASFVDYTERLARAAIAELPDGEFAFEDWIDDDGVDYGKPIRLFCTVRKTGSSIVVDWTGCAPQVKGAINCTYSFAKAVSYTAIKSIIPNDIPTNEGVFRVIEVVAPEGTIANMLHPAACAARGLTGFRMLDCAFGALAKMIPDRVFAASDGGNTGISIGGYYADRKPFIYVDFACSAWGGRPWADGVDGNANLFGNIALQSVELAEAENPVQIDCWEFVSDTGGAGKFRGGSAVRRQWKLLEAEAVVQVRSDRRDFLPYGLYGGKPGKGSMNWFNPATDGSELPSKFTLTFRRDDTLRHETAGGGGWGDPLERDPEAVLRDVRNEYVSLDTAREIYGVAVDTTVWRVDTTVWRVDEVATERLRAEARRARGTEPLPAVDRGDGLAA